MRALRFAALGLAVLGVGAAVALNVYLNAWVKTAAERSLAPMIGAPFKLAAVALSPLSGKGSLLGIEIGNPRGFESPYFAKIGKVAIELDLKTLLSDAVVIKRVEVVDADVIYETGLGGSNAGKIREALEAGGGRSRTRSARRFIIDDLRITGVKARVMVRMLESDTVVPVPDLQLKGIGRKSNGATAREALGGVLLPFTRSIIGAAAGADGGNPLLQAADGVRKSLKGLLGR